MDLLIYAAEYETAPILKEVEVLSYERLGYTKLFRCAYLGKTFLLGVSGIGKAFAAAALSAILTKCGDEIDSIYNLGVGGSLEAKEAPIFSFVTSKCLYEHDLDTSAIGDPVGLISGINLIEIPADKALSEKASKAAKRLGAPIVSAVISSGDVFYDKKEDKERIRNQFGSLCVDMESAPFGQIAYVYQKPYLAVRCISDAGDGGQFYENLEKSCALLKDFALELIKD